MTWRSFRQSLQAAQGRDRQDMADAAYIFYPVPHISLALLYWVGDEEFPAEAKLLFDQIGQWKPGA